MKHLNLIAWTVATAAASALAVAQTAVTPAKSAADAKAAIEARQNVFKDIKKAYEPLTDMLKRKREFDAALVATNAVTLQGLVQQIPAHFTVDTHTFTDTKTLARENIWTSQADFKAKADAASTALGNLATVAKTGDQGATSKAIGDVGKSCGACHDNFKDKP
ncbi:MAG: cytochrome c [Pseudomonadota bacterium]